jgi:feruloyl esterase
VAVSTGIALFGGTKTMKQLGVWLLALGASGAVQAATTCSDLLKFQIPGMNLVITNAETVPAAPPLPAHCRADGMVNERKGADGRTYGIGFGIALPEAWNHRFLFQGGGGYNGTVRPPTGPAGAADKPALARGFAVVSTDSGHKGETFDRSYDVDQQASLDFAQVAVARVTEIAKQIVARYYGQAADHSYFAGCSTGGREAMLMTQRYPSYFDGVISGDPAMRTGFSRLGNSWRNVAFAQNAPKDAAGLPQLHKLFSEADQKTLTKGILNACDADDGLKDGMIFNPEACRFDAKTLLCTSANTDACLTQPQVTALERAFPGPKSSKGELIYRSSLYDADVAALLPSTKPPEPSAQRPAPATSIDVDARLFELLHDPLEALTDTTWTNLSSFSGHGGKLLFYHGMSDPTFAATDTLDYYKRMADTNGGADKVQQWSKFYLVPGMLHCRGGEAALDQFDLLDALVNWVEHGTAPDAVVATGAALPGRSRPLCPYPKHAQYTGKGNPEDAKSFVCQ